MIDADHAFASGFLWAAGIAFLAAFALPLFLAPLLWARCFKWRIPEERNLVVYLGRSLGAAGIAIVWVSFQAARDPENHPYVFDLIILAGMLLTVVHIWGAIKRTQPWTENLEILFYVILTGAAIWARSSVL